MICPIQSEKPFRISLFLRSAVLLIFLLPPFLFSREPLLSSILIADGFQKPLYLISHPENPDLLFVVEQAGKIKLIKNGKPLDAPFLDITGRTIRELRGTYFFGDYCSGNIWSFRIVRGKAVNFTRRTEELNLGQGEFTNYISSFGRDAHGELHIDYNGGVYKLISVN